MKTIFLFLLLGFAWQSSDAIDIRNALPSCLIENGFTNSTSDMELIYAVGDPHQMDKLKNVSKEKMAKVIACLYHKTYPKKRVYESLRQLLDRDDMVTKEQVKQMEETSYPCYKKAAGDDAKLLSCLNITEPPFDHLFVTFRDIPQSLYWCFVKCNVQISELYTMKKKNNGIASGFIKYVPQERLNCFVPCKTEEEIMVNPNTTYKEKLRQLIFICKSIDEITKKEMYEILNRCGSLVSNPENEREELTKCIEPSKPPFLYLC